MFGKVKKVHFVGIGGIGMSGIAELLINLGFKIYGSDLNPTEITKKLEAKGATIYTNHSYDNVKECDVLVYSSAVTLDNPEIHAARDNNIPIIRRAEMLGELLKLKERSIAVAGTHGKTTTTSMIGALLTEAGIDPTIVVGGVVKSLDVNAILGSGNTIVVEADEFDRSFLQLQPTYSIITTIDLDHMECYQNKTDLFNSFTQFANAVPFYGAVIACLDEPYIQNILPDIHRPVISYGFSNQADLQAKSVAFNEMDTNFQVQQNGSVLGKIHLNVPGKHNVCNALAVVALGLELNLDFKTIQTGLNSFQGVQRRQEIKGVFNDLMVMDDYAHHPTEVLATLEAIKQGWNRRLVSVFQPHLYSRTQKFYEEFARSFLLSDVLIVTDIYPAREEPIEGLTGKVITDAAKRFGHKNVHWVEDKNAIVDLLEKIASPGDIIITMGAGDIWKINDEFVNLLTEKNIKT
ncbi:MAG: UDP-N-acetylmuramate--L-alanine ligase [Candidatus Marinimicrobia bacterium]|nr:UDP-N-acetylmuramate--L-alanine ligase [Candidatus Neomarinimicrobiota bacterium]MBL7046105.1 UDP-N-acetylmuramate--L-alanine ligase [Candidatus Neomarinimicrobiota bacterium]